MSSIRLPAAAVGALARGQLIEAVKIVRQTGGLGLKEAHDLVLAYQQQAVREPGGVANASPAMPTASAPGQSGGFVFPQDASDALARGEMIEAIAALRRANPQLDLRTAKTAIDRFREEHAPAKPSGSPMPHRARVPTVVHGDSGGHAVLFAAIAAVLVAAAWWWFGGRG